MTATYSVGKMLGMLTMPMRKNGIFFFFMYLLGLVSAWLTLPGGKYENIYDNLYVELFLDTFVVCVLLSFLPDRLRKILCAFFSVVAYVVTIADVFCFVKFDSTITPTMLMLLGETDSREAGEFINTYFSADVIFSPVGVILLVALVHLLFALPMKKRLRNWRFTRISNHWRWCMRQGMKSIAFSVAFEIFLIYAIFSCASNKAATWRLMSCTTIGEVEHELTEKDHAVLYSPLWRLAFSLRANYLTSKQIVRLVETADRVKVDSCSYRSPEIVLIIGESYSRHHSSQYGYHMPTAPRQTALERKGELVKFTDVVTPWNLTSFVFKLMFSTYVVGDKGEWCDYPLFPELFRKADYRVTFLTNQFLPKAKEAVYDFSGGFFLNDPKLSAAQFDVRNTELHFFDEDLLMDYDRLRSDSAKHNLTIFHLIGQHVNYNRRFPRRQRKFYANDYDKAKPHLSKKERNILSFYDNAVLYNDSVVCAIVDKFREREAIVIYAPDHGEECFEGDMHFYCRMHSTAIDRRLAHAEFDIPFWIWCSDKYRKAHPDVFAAIKAAADKRFMTDALPHLLLYLGGISSPDYRSDCNPLAPDYNEMRPRILKNQTDYDKIK